MLYRENRDELLSGKMSFKPEEVKKGNMDRFIQVLMENNAEMHIWTDGYCWIVEYIEDVYADECAFYPVDCDEVIEKFDKEEQ